MMENALRKEDVFQEGQQRPTASVFPLLENGDRLTIFEFERRYHRMPHVKKAELVEGVVYMPSPVRITTHGGPHADIVIWLGEYKISTPTVMLGDNSTVRLDMENELQPDALLRIVEARGGQSRISEDGYLEGPPELIVEVAASSVSYDMHDKFRAYQRSGVLEYLVWLVHDGEFRWYVLTDGAYQLQAPDEEGVLVSRTFPGLRLDVNALLSGDMRRVLDVLQEGIGSEAHRAFMG